MVLGGFKTKRRETVRIRSFLFSTSSPIAVRLFDENYCFRVDAFHARCTAENVALVSPYSIPLSVNISRRLRLYLRVRNSDGRHRSTFTTLLTPLNDHNCTPREFAGKVVFNRWQWRRAEINVFRKILAGAFFAFNNAIERINFWLMDSDVTITVSNNAVS